MTDLVTTSEKDGILTIRMNRPDKKNALTHEMYDAMATALENAEKNPDIRVVMIAGAKGAFCAGNDLQDFLENPPDEKNSPVLRFLNALSNAKLPLVAAVGGTAVGVGVTMLLHCDFVYVSNKANMSLPFVDLGLVPEAAASMLLPKLTGHLKAAEMLMLGEPFNAQTAVDIGLANVACDPADVETTALATAKKLAAKPRTALQQTKSLLKRDFESVADRIAAEAKVFKECLTSDDAKEALSAFKEKRKPKFN